MLFAPLGILLVIKTLKGEWYIVINAYKFTVFEILRDFCIIIYCVSTLPNIESNNPIIWL